MRRFDDEFLALAYGRIQRALITFTIAAAVALFPAQGWRMSLGVVAGGLLALVNFVWMRKSMIALTDRITDSADTDAQKRVKSTVFMRFFLRYALIVMALSVIISRSSTGAHGMLIGLLLVVPALMFEAVYEAIHALRSGE
jgi:hypothetical protein